MKKLTAVLLFCFFGLFAKADTFTVTSNADSGPGTLREAITLANANGHAVTDYIYFAIADISVAGRTIALRSSLSDLASNLVIDGSTQAGSKFGVSDAKIRITTAPDAEEMPYVFRIADEQDISFFGLHLDNLRLSSPSMITSAIALQNARNVLIGMPGKGNYFTRLDFVAGDAYYSPAGKGMNDGIAFKSNIINLSENGDSLVSNAYVFTFNNIRNLTLGGEQEKEGNFISAGREYIGWTYTDTFAHVNTGTYVIMNNKFGCNFSQTSPLPCGAIYLRNGNSYGYTDTTKIIIKNNSFNTSCYSFSCPLYNYIMLENKKGFIDIKANRFNVLNAARDFYFPVTSTAISIGACENGIIGGDNPADSNVIAGMTGYAIAMGDNNAIRITKNSIFCNSHGIIINSAKLPVPKTEIFTITDYLVKGTTLPKSNVEVFLTKRCASCDNGEIYLGNTMADDTGGWAFTSPVLLEGAITATGTSLEGVTGEFAKPEYGFENYDYQFPTCNQNNGFIKGIRFVAGTRYYWVHSSANGVDTLFTEDISNAGPGIYRFVVEQGKYCSTTFSLSLEDMSPRINAQNKNMVQPSCGLNNGRIADHYLYGSYNKIMWKDSSGNVVGTSQDLLDIGPGKYKLIILDTIHGCGDSTGFYTLVNQSGPSLNSSRVKITPATCNSSNGSISGITASNVTGTPLLQWLDSLDNVVGNDYNLQNVPPGRYRLKFKDASSCDTIVTPFYTVGNEGEIVVDTSRMIISPAKCTGATGSIQIISATGGETYVWKNSTTGTTLGNALNVFNLPAGDYQLTVSNSFGCSKTLPPITVPQASFIPIQVLNLNSAPATCGRINGFVQITGFNRDTSLYTFRWVDSASGQTINRFTNLYNVPNGTYFLFARDSNGCEGQVLVAVLLGRPDPAFDYTNLQVTPDNCLSGSGAIQGLAVNNLSGGTATYVWTNSAGEIVGNTISLKNLPPETYQLTVTDATGCVVTSQPITVGNTNSALTAPHYDEQTILKNTAATVTVKNPQAGTYYLYDSPLAQNPLQENTTGNFTTPVLTTDKIYYVRLVNGVCQSDLVAVSVKVIDKTAIYVPSAFTPNGDGKNDVLKAIAFGRVKLRYFTIYNRWGETVFSTENFSKGWNGTVQGKPAETGVYVWIIKATDELNGRTIEQKGTVLVVR